MTAQKEPKTTKLPGSGYDPYGDDPRLAGVPRPTEEYDASYAKIKIDRLTEALCRMVYETTCLSPQRDDGSHDCRISKAALAAAREALKI